MLSAGNNTNELMLANFDLYVLGREVVRLLGPRKFSANRNEVATKCTKSPITKLQVRHLRQVLAIALVLAYRGVNAVKTCSLTFNTVILSDLVSLHKGPPPHPSPLHHKPKPR